MFTEEVTPSGRVWLGYGIFIGLIIAWNLYWFVVTLRILNAGIPVVVVIPLGAFILLKLIIHPLRITIDGQTLTVRMGLFRERIALDQIDTFTPARYDVLSRYFWGVRSYLLPRTVRFIATGVDGKSVKIITKKGKTVQFSTRNPEAVCEALRTRMGLVVSHSR